MGGDLNSCIRLALVEVKDIYCVPREWMSVKCLYCTAAGKIIIIMKPHSYNVILWMPEYNQVLPIAYQPSLCLRQTSSLFCSLKAVCLGSDKAQCHHNQM